MSTSPIAEASTPLPPWLQDTIKVIFSWVILMPIAVIVAGKLLAQRFRMTSSSAQLFRIPIPGLLIIEARNDEVILGFSSFIFTLSVLSAVAGQLIYELFKGQFGVDPGQFNSLCVFSSFATVVWCSILYVVSQSGTSPIDKEKHDELINKISKRKPNDLDDLNK